MTPEDWKEMFESETIVSRQLAVATGDRRYDDPCNGELKKDQEYVLLIDDAGGFWLEDRPEHGVFPCSWFKIIEDPPLEPKVTEADQTTGQACPGDQLLCINGTASLHEGEIYTVSTVKNINHGRWIDTFVSFSKHGFCYPMTRFRVISEPNQAMMRADEYNPVGESRQPSERELAWEQSQHQAETNAHFGRAAHSGTIHVNEHRLSRAVRLTEARAIHPQAMCYHIDQ